MWSHRDVAIDGPFGKGRGSIHGLAFTPDSKRLAGGMSAIPDAGSRAVCFWDVKKLEDAKIEARGHTAADQPAVVEFVAFTPDGKVMASGGFTRALRVWRFERRGRDRGWKPVCEHPDECENGRQLGHTMCAAFAPDGARLVVGDTRGRIHVYAGAGWRREKSFVAHPGSHVREVCWSVDGRRLYSCGGDLRVWKADSLEAVKTITLPGGAAGRTIMSIAPAPDGKRVACVDSAGALHVIALP